MSLWEQRRDSTKAYGTPRECGRGDDHLVFSRGRDLSGWCEDKMLLTSTVYGGVYACFGVPEVGRVGGNNGGYWVGGWTVEQACVYGSTRYIWDPRLTLKMTLKSTFFGSKIF